MGVARLIGHRSELGDTALYAASELDGIPIFTQPIEGRDLLRQILA
jgi:hypothetical protein